MNVDQWAVDLGQKLRSEDLHVAGQHDKIHISAQHIELATLCLGPIISGRRHMKVGHRKGSDLIGEIGVV